MQMMNTIDESSKLNYEPYVKVSNLNNPNSLSPILSANITRITKKRRKFSVRIAQQNVVLTQREYDCLLCLLEGKTAKETAKKLCISNRTVEHYLCNVRQKTSLFNKSALLAMIWSHQR